MDLQRLSPGVKRSHDGVPVLSELTPDSTGMQTSPAAAQSQRAASPALSSTGSSLSDVPTMSSKALQLTDPTQPPPKKAKLTFAEREVEKAVKKAEKEKQARFKAEEKARKAEEKQTRDEEKRRKAEEKEEEKARKEIVKAEKDANKVKKDAEKAERKKARDAEKAEKEAEKAQKEAEKLKKERSQMRLGNFFGRPAPAATPPSTPGDVSSGVSSRRSSVASVDMPEPVLSTMPSATSDEFGKWILPFFPHDHTTVAPYNRFLTSGSATPVCVDLPTQYPNATSQPLRQRFRHRLRRLKQIAPVRTLIDLVGASEHTLTDVTGEQKADEASMLLSQTPYKILSFREDVRPPYRGTFTRPVSPPSRRRLSRKPTARALPDMNYDYDSEAEWQAPEEGDEDLDDDDEMSEDEAEADEMADFLDDENDNARRKLVTDVEPVCTGLCWEGETDLTGLKMDINSYRMDVLHDDTNLPIDPHSNEHWSDTGKTTPMKAKSPAGAQSLTMLPPRLPLATLAVPNKSPLPKIARLKAGGGSDQQENTSSQPQRGRPKKSDKPVKTISDELLPSFKNAIAGSDLNKVALVEILKKQFPTCPKDAIKGTLEMVAVRQGKKEADKRWVLMS